MSKSLLRPKLVFLAVLLCGAPTGCVVSQDSDRLQNAAVLLRDAESLLSAAKYQESAAKASEAAKLLPESVIVLQRAAEILYRAGESKKSLPLFASVVELSPEDAPHNWQRGLALCSCGEWKKGAAQFKTHHDVNPDDVENSAWYFLCVAKLEGIEAARKTVIPSRGDGRQPMMSVLQMLKGELEPDRVMEAAIKNTSEGTARQTAQFYADLYIGLYYDSLGDAQNAKKHLKRSLGYGGSGYMVDSARVYLEDRFGEPSKKQK